MPSLFFFCHSSYSTCIILSVFLLIFIIPLTEIILVIFEFH
jgi:hypothetical protein